MSSSECVRVGLDRDERSAISGPRQLARALVEVAPETPPRRRFSAGADAIDTAEQKFADLQADIALNRERFVALDVDAG